MKSKFVSLLAVLLLASCSQVNEPNFEETKNQNDTPTAVSSTGEDTPTIASSTGEVKVPFKPADWKYRNIEEEIINVSRENVEISSLEIRGIPKEGIKITCFDEHEIYLDVLYSDGVKESIRFLEKNIPLEFRHYLGEIGHHTISFAVAGSVINFSFDIIKKEGFDGYTCTFLDLRDHHDEPLQVTKVGYYESVSYTGVLPENRKIDDDNTQCFIGWDNPLEYVHQDMYYIAQYRDVEKRYFGDELANLDEMLITSNKKDNVNRALSYLGRVHSVAINYGESRYHTKDNAEEAFSFTSLNPYGLKWNEMNQNIFEDSIGYVTDPNYGSYLYGTTGAFNTSPTFLDSFESYYEVSPKEVSIVTGYNETKAVQTSINPSFGTCYSTSETYLNETRNLNSEAESGYYRLALTMSFDVYVSTSFEKITDNRYGLLKGSKFIFAPVSDSETVRLEFSENVEFRKTFEKRLNFSTKNLYDVANSLDW